MILTAHKIWGESMPPLSKTLQKPMSSGTPRETDPDPRDPGLHTQPPRAAAPSPETWCDLFP